jgi:uncharacterized protein (DUF924 family)
MEARDPRAQQVLQFWFGSGDRDKRWFEKNPAFDAEIRARFLPLYEQAVRGELGRWTDERPDFLALIVLLDQFPRNMFRGTPRAFASDTAALQAAKHAVAQGYDRGLRPSERMFVYLPFQHAESMPDQIRSCDLNRALEPFPETHDTYRYALAHRDIVERFGRFPHRNAILGRTSTPEELEFLKGPASSF